MSKLKLWQNPNLPIEERLLIADSMIDEMRAAFDAMIHKHEEDISLIFKEHDKDCSDYEDRIAELEIALSRAESMIEQISGPSDS